MTKRELLYVAGGIVVGLVFSRQIGGLPLVSKIPKA